MLYAIVLRAFSIGLLSFEQYELSGQSIYYVEDIKTETSGYDYEVVLASPKLWQLS